MRFTEIASRLTGISTPLFGVQWNPARLDRDVALEVISFLEDRRVLYDPYRATGVPGGSPTPNPDRGAGIADAAAAGAILGIHGGPLILVTPGLGQVLTPRAQEADAELRRAVGYTVQSVLQIRDFLTGVLGKGGISQDLTGHLKAMRASCREMLAVVNPESKAIVVARSQLKLRQDFGLQIAQRSVKYGIDVDEPLAAILPLGPPGSGEE